MEFQSTRPRGARPAVARVLAAHPRFNPRAREGRDDIVAEGIAKEKFVSIHAPARGATVFIFYAWRSRI